MPSLRVHLSRSRSWHTSAESRGSSPPSKLDFKSSLATEGNDSLQTSSIENRRPPTLSQFKVDSNNIPQVSSVDKRRPSTPSDFTVDASASKLDKQSSIAPEDSMSGSSIVHNKENLNGPITADRSKGDPLMEARPSTSSQASESPIRSSTSTSASEVQVRRLVSVGKKSASEVPKTAVGQVVEVSAIEDSLTGSQCNIISASTEIPYTQQGSIPHQPAEDARERRGSIWQPPHDWASLTGDQTAADTNTCRDTPMCVPPNASPNGRYSSSSPVSTNKLPDRDAIEPSASASAANQEGLPKSGNVGIHSFQNYNLTQGLSGSTSPGRPWNISYWLRKPFDSVAKKLNSCCCSLSHCCRKDIPDADSLQNRPVEPSFERINNGYPTYSQRRAEQVDGASRIPSSVRTSDTIVPTPLENGPTTSPAVVDDVQATLASINQRASETIEQTTRQLTGELIEQANNQPSVPTSRGFLRQWKSDGTGRTFLARLQDFRRSRLPRPEERRQVEPIPLRRRYRSSQGGLPPTEYIPRPEPTIIIPPIGDFALPNIPPSRSRSPSRDASISLLRLSDM